MDGIIFEQKKRISNDLTLYLQFYMDEFEVANPLGAKTGKQKQLAVYFTILNLETKYRSKLKNIHLALLAKNVWVEKYGLDVLLSPLIKDLNILATSGFNVEINGTNHNNKGEVLFISGDNLSLHKLGGFSQCFNSGRVCRFCLASKPGLSQMQAQVNSVQVDPTLKSIYGVNGPCIFSNLSNFDVTKHLAPDIMHDVLEGVIPLILKHLICAVIRTRFVTM